MQNINEATITYDDIDCTQPKKNAGVACNGSSARTTALIQKKKSDLFSRTIFRGQKSRSAEKKRTMIRTGSLTIR